MVDMLSLALITIPVGIALYFLLRLVIVICCPRPPEKVREYLRKIEKATASGEWYDNSDIFELDRALMEAEMESPGSTLLLYFERNKILTAVGSFIVALSGLGWLKGIFTINNWIKTLLFFVFGFIPLLAPLIYVLPSLLEPLIQWLISRPRRL